MGVFALGVEVYGRLSSAPPPDVVLYASNILHANLQLIADQTTAGLEMWTQRCCRGGGIGKSCGFNSPGIERGLPQLCRTAITRAPANNFVVVNVQTHAPLMNHIHSTLVRNPLPDREPIEVAQSPLAPCGQHMRVQDVPVAGKH